MANILVELGAVTWAEIGSGAGVVDRGPATSPGSGHYPATLSDSSSSGHYPATLSDSSSSGQYPATLADSGSGRFAAAPSSGAGALPEDLARHSLEGEDARELQTALADPSKRLGPYVILREQGRGGMGVVFKAYDPNMRRLVAIKKIHGAATGVQLQRFRREAQLLGKLRHPGIADVHEVVTEGPGAPYFVMEYVEGTPLAGLIEREELTHEQMTEIMIAAARAIAFAHGQGILHRDLKPQNIVVTPTGRPVVLDFGIAKEQDPQSLGLTAPGEIMGTLSYMAPEQADGTKEVGAAADVYGLGATLYQCLTGVPPFEGESHDALLAAVLEEAPDPPSSFDPTTPPELEEICLRCLEKRPGKRFGSTAKLADALQEFLIAFDSRERVRRTRSRALVFAAGLLLGGGLGFLGGWVAPRGEIVEQPERAARQVEGPPAKLARTVDPKESLRSPPAKAKPKETTDPAVMWELGWKYENGWRVPKADFVKSTEWYRRSASLGYLRGITSYAQALWNGRGVPKDTEKARRLFQKAAEAGDAFAEGSNLQFGLGVPKDPERALELYLKAARAGHPRAMNYLAGMLAEGDGIPKDLPRAAEWARKSAQAGYLRVAAPDLGRKLLRGLGVPVNVAEGVRWYERAIKAGHHKQLVDLGDNYLNGVGVSKQPGVALRYYKRAAELRIPAGMHRYAYMLAVGLGVVPVDMEDSAFWMRMSAEAGHPTGMLEMAKSYCVGRGVPMVYVKAAEWFRKACAAKEPGAAREFRSFLRRLPRYRKPGDPE